jgi:hypothetical protein
MIVVWNGRADAPLGRYLFATEEVRVEPPAMAPQVRPRMFSDGPQPAHARIAAALKNGTATQRELMHALDMRQTVVNSALYQLRKKGLVAVMGVRPKTGGMFRTELLYGLRGD